MLIRGTHVVTLGRDLVAKHGVDPLYILHFEYNFDKTNLKQTVKTEVDVFRKALAQ